MRKGMALLLIFVSVVVFGSTEAPPWSLRNDAPALDISVSVSPVREGEYRLLKPRPRLGSYHCGVLIRDVDDRDGGALNSSLIIAPGEKAERTRTLGPLRIHFAARIANPAHYAQTVVTVTREGKLISRQNARVSLRPVAEEQR